MMMLLFFLVAVAITSQALAAIDVKENVFRGIYSDPNHPNCKRFVLFESDTAAKVFGFDAAGGEGVPCDGKTDQKWGPLPASISGNSIEVDFSSKGGPSDVAGVFNSTENAIDWSDGNSWPRIFPTVVAAKKYADKSSASVSLFDGEYTDPNHPSCGRFVLAQDSSSAQIYGVDAAGGEGASCDGVTDTPWNVPAVLVSKTSIIADFSSKGGPEGLKGDYNIDASEIDWEDGNAWPKVQPATAN